MTIQRLLLIDPEDADQAERLMRAYWQQRDEGRGLSDAAWVPSVETERMQAALRNLAQDVPR